MNEVIEALGSNETLPAVLAAPDYLPGSVESLRWGPSGLRRSDTRVSGRWSSTLCQQDLQCLLQVIETDLIPRLLSGYSPAASAPLPLPESPG